MGAAQICSALSHIRQTWEWKEETIVATVWNNQVFVEILAKERAQKGRVTVFFGDKKQP